METTDYPRKTCSFYGNSKDAITSSFNEFKMALAVLVRKNRGILRCHSRATAFSQVRLFLDMPFPPKIPVSGYVRIGI